MVHKPRKTLEIGFAYGISTLYLCQAHHDLGRKEEVHLALDPNQTTQWGRIGVHSLERAGLSHLMSHREMSDFVGLPFLLHAGERFQFVLIDGAHTLDYTLLDVTYVDLMLDVGGFVVFDDAHMPAVDQAISFFLANQHYREATADDLLIDMDEIGYPSSPPKVLIKLQ
jgi:predicted O-methyltransferase YrrM